MAQEPTLIGVTGPDGFEDEGAFGGFFAAGHLMDFGVKGFTGFGFKDGEAHAAGDAAAGVLEIANLGGEFGLTGTGGGVMEGVDVIENPHQDLEPFAFAAAEFVDFEPEGGFLLIIGFLHEVVEFTDFDGHFFGDFAGAGDGLGRVAFHGFLHAAPLIGDGGDLSADGFDVSNLVDGSAEGVDFDDFHEGAVFQNEGQGSQHGAHDHQTDDQDRFGNGKRMGIVPDEGAGISEEDDVGQQERPLGNI